MRTLLALIFLWPLLTFGQIPDEGRFDYLIYDNGNRVVGTYFFTINKESGVWRISSDMSIDTSFLRLPIRVRDKNTFTHDGKNFLSFNVNYFKDVPLKNTIHLYVSGTRNSNGWAIQIKNNRKSDSQQFSHQSFEEVRNLVSRLVRPEATLGPGQVKKTLSLDPLTLEIGEVESRGVEMDSVEFQGKKRDLYVMETKASDGNVKVHKFSNGLIYRSQTSDGYALLKSAQASSF